MSAADALARELLPRLRRWTAQSWALPATPDPAAPAPSVRPPASATRRADRGPDDGGPAGEALVAGSGGPPTRAAVAAATVQRLADVVADAEGRPRRPVPRLVDTALADQLAVMVDDVLRTGDPAAAAVTAAELAALARALGYRA